jgi:hypothetical protein
MLRQETARLRTDPMLPIKELRSSTEKTDSGSRAQAEVLAPCQETEAAGENQERPAGGMDPQAGLHKGASMEFVVWAIAGWCGTGTLRYQFLLQWLRRIRFPPPPPDPEWPIDGFVGPRPWIEALIGIAGGLAGGLLFNSMATGEVLTRVDLAATSFGALLGGNLLSRVFSLIILGRETVRH